MSLEASARQATAALFAASRSFHERDESVKELSHHGRFELRSGGWFRAGEEPKYDATDVVGASSRVEDFCVSASAQLDPSSQVWPEDGGALRARVFEYLDATREGPSRYVRSALRCHVLASDRHKRRRRRRDVRDEPEDDGDDDGGGGALTTSLSETPSMLRLLRYPADARGTLSTHTDFEVFTVIHQRRRGLQINVDGSWTWARPAPSDDFCVVLAGDALEFWSNGAVKAAPHRVRRHPAADADERFSIVLFHAARDDADLAPLKHLAMRGTPLCPSYLDAKRKADLHHGGDDAPLTQLRHLLCRVAAAEANGIAADDEDDAPQRPTQKRPLAL